MGKPPGCCKIRLPDDRRPSWLLSLLNPSHRPDSAAATVHQQHYLTRRTTGAIALTGFPNSNSEKNLYQGSFFKSISSGLISRLYKGWWQGNGRKRRITLCKRLHRNRPVEMQRLWVTQHLLLEGTVRFYWHQQKSGHRNWRERTCSQKQGHWGWEQWGFPFQSCSRGRRTGAGGLGTTLWPFSTKQHGQNASPQSFQYCRKDGPYFLL